jgi:glycine oxidase
MLVNPATGRRAKMSWHAEEALYSISDLLQRVKEFSGESFYENNGVVRPALYPEIGFDFKRAPEKYNWPDGWIKWLEIEEFSSRHPVFESAHGGLIIKNGITVEGSRYVKLLSQYLEANGLITAYNTKAEYSHTESVWNLSLSSGETIQTKFIICATGSSLIEDSNWDFLPMNSIKGQTATFRFNESVPLNCSVSSLGYLAYKSSSPDELVVGSTYEHTYEDLNPNEKGLNYLKDKLNRTLPGWSEKIIEWEQWAGVRVSSKDNMPIIGNHPELNGLYIFGALGSKGMIHGRYVAQQIADHIADGKPIDLAISINRFV